MAQAVSVFPAEPAALLALHITASWGCLSAEDAWVPMLSCFNRLANTVKIVKFYQKLWVYMKHNAIMPRALKKK